MKRRKKEKCEEEISFVLSSFKRRMVKVSVRSFRISVVVSAWRQNNLSYEKSFEQLILFSMSCSTRFKTSTFFLLRFLLYFRRVFREHLTHTRSTITALMSERTTKWMTMLRVLTIIITVSLIVVVIVKPSMHASYHIVITAIQTLNNFLWTFIECRITCFRTFNAIDW